MTDERLSLMMRGRVAGIADSALCSLRYAEHLASPKYYEDIERICSEIGDLFHRIVEDANDVMYAGVPDYTNAVDDTRIFGMTHDEFEKLPKEEQDRLCPKFELPDAVTSQCKE